MGRARRIGAGLVVLLLFLPASTTFPTARVNIQRVQRLYQQKRESPDAWVDRSFRMLVPFVPTQGNVGYQKVGPPDFNRLFYRAQYALVPRQILLTTDADFVVESGPADAAESLSRDERYRLVTSPHDLLRLFRRIQ